MTSRLEIARDTSPAPNSKIVLNGETKKLDMFRGSRGTARALGASTVDMRGLKCDWRGDQQEVQKADDAFDYVLDNSTSRRHPALEDKVIRAIKPMDIYKSQIICSSSRQSGSKQQMTCVVN